MTKPTTTILLTALPWWDDVPNPPMMGYALTTDGAGVLSHFSSSLDYSKHDLTVLHKRDYDEMYPDGYELVWIDNPENDERWQAALKLNREKPEGVNQ